MKPKIVKRREAQERQEAYDALTLEEKIARADAAPGQSKRELARLTGGCACRARYGPDLDGTYPARALCPRAKECMK